MILTFTVIWFSFLYFKIKTQVKIDVKVIAYTNDSYKKLDLINYNIGIWVLTKYLYEC
jgi:hypothetical protein